MPEALQIAETVRNACLQAALNAFEDAGISGLCLEGRWEIALQAIRTLELEPLIGSFGDAPARRTTDPAADPPS